MKKIIDFIHVIMTFTICTVLLWHILTPSKYHWMDDNQFVAMDLVEILHLEDIK